MTKDEDTYEHHSYYKQYEIIKVTQPHGRVTYDIRHPDGSPDTFDHESLAVAKANINATVHQ